MISIRKSSERGHRNYGWLDTYHSFSFADYHDPRFVRFRALRVLNDDTVLGGGGFDTHPHHDMEIITYVISGALRHRDSLGHTSVIRAGEVQRITAGTGIEHSEHNESRDEPVHLIQVWILPERRGLEPSYAERDSGSLSAANGLALVASRDGRDGSVTIHQDADVYLARLDAGGTARREIRHGRHAWVQVAEGEVDLNGRELAAGDGAALSDEDEWTLRARTPAQVLVFDLA
jgi:redox-sensitive bicupin YhaK (pirin superfamily)